MPEVYESKDQLSKKPLHQLKDMVNKDAWIALSQYFNKKGNGSEAKVACVVIGTIAREMQSQNNARQLDIIEKRLGYRLKSKVA